MGATIVMMIAPILFNYVYVLRLFFHCCLRGSQRVLKIRRLHTFSELVLYDIRINHTLYSKNV